MGFSPTRYSPHSNLHPTGWSPVGNRYISHIRGSNSIPRIGNPKSGMNVAVQQEKIIRTDSGVLCVSIYGAWRPIKLVLTERRLVCQQGSNIVWSVPLYEALRVNVVEARVVLGLKRKALLIEVGKAKGLVYVKNPEEWRNLIQSRTVPGLQSEAEVRGQ